MNTIDSAQRTAHFCASFPNKLIFFYLTKGFASSLPSVYRKLFCAALHQGCYFFIARRKMRYLRPSLKITAVAALLLSLLSFKLPTSAPHTLGLGFTSTFILIPTVTSSTAGIYSFQSEDKPMVGFMKVTEQVSALPKTQLVERYSVTLPDIKGSKGAVLFALLVALSSIVCLRRKI